MKKLARLFTSITLFGLSVGQAQADITFTFTESGGNVVMQSSGILNTANLVSASPGAWYNVGVETNGSPESDVMGDTTMGNINTAFGFNADTDLSPWIGNMFTSSNFDWTSSGTTQFTTYWYNPTGVGLIPGFGISSDDLVGALWTPDVSWSKSGTFASLGLTAGTYRITDAVTNEAITIQIGSSAVVPEPDACAAFLAGLGLLGLVARRKSV